jgi:hypothetical protein
MRFIFLFLFLTLLALGCQPPEERLFFEGEVVTIKVSSRPGIVHRIGPNYYEVRYEDNMGVIQEIFAQEYELEKK